MLAWSVEKTERLPINPTNRNFLNNLKVEFNKSSALLLPMKNRIKSTDGLVDRIIYRLHGLTEEETNLSERSMPIHDTKGIQSQVTIETNPDLVWYAGYGSNLLKGRFMCYITGGSPEGSRKRYAGCHNNELPRGDKPIRIPHQLYFSKRSRIWTNMAVAFVKSKRNETAGTLGRMYLITRDQFVEIVRQENGLNPDDRSIKVDLETVISDGESIVSNNWYGRVVHIGHKGGIPIFLVTGPWSDEEISPGRPSEEYLLTIVKGVKDTYDISDGELAEYLRNADGIKGEIDEQTILRIIKNL